jgi:putative ABC transport system ATP-binding protein
MEPNLFKYIWQHSKGEQLVILLLVLISMPFYFVSLDLPKSIVNKGIQGQGFDGPGSTLPFLHFELPFGEALFGETVVLFDGFDFEQEDLVLGLSFAFLGFVLINGAFKFYINTMKGRMGERMLRRLRFELTDRVLRFPVLHLRRIKQAEYATMIKDEVEPLGGFIGDAFVSPAFLGGQAITAMVFIIVESMWLGLVAAAIVLFQAFLIPKLRKRILQLNKERQLTARQLAGRIAELVEGGIEVHAHDTSNFERADIVSRLGRIFGIRFEIFQRKFFVKFLNNLLSQFTPFVFYSLGGLLAIRGHLDIGALVAVIAAYKDLPGPVKELIDWDQRRLDVQIKYDQVIEQFQPPDLIEPSRQDPQADPGPPLDGEVVVSTVSLIDETNTRLVDSVSFSFHTADHLAIVGNSASGKEHVGMLLAGLIRPTSGAVRLAGRELDEVPEAVTGRRLSYVGQDAYHFPQSVRENLIYGLKHLPITPAVYDDAGAAAQARLAAEAERAGNPTLDFAADWTDYAAVGVSGPEDMTNQLVQVLRQVDLEESVYRFGLTGTIDPKERPEVAEEILRARSALLERLEQAGASDLVVHFDPESYNGNATLAENLLFGTSTKPDLESDALAENPVVLEVLREGDMIDPLLVMGETIAKTMVELFADLPAGHPFFEQFSFIEEDDLPEFRALVTRAEKGGIAVLAEADRMRLLRLPFKYVEARHRLGLVDEAVQAKVLDARRRIAERLEESDPGAVEAYRPDGYNGAASLQDNILFGRLAYGQARAQETVGEAMTGVLDELGLRRTVLEVGLDYEVGVGGKRLSQVDRQKLAIARALLKQPDLLIVNEAAAVMDAPTQSRVMDGVLEARQGRGVVWTLQQPEAAERFGRVLVMSNGRVVEDGHFDELNQADSALGQLIAAG